MIHVAFENIQLISSGNGKYSIMATFEIGESGEFAQRILCSNLSKKKGEALVLKMKKGEI